MKVYLDNGATTKVAKEVVSAMMPWFEVEGNPSSLHSYGRDALEAIEESRMVIAKKLGANTGEIIFTSGGTESDNMAIKGIVSVGDHVITSSIEHPAVRGSCKELEKNGCGVTFLDVDNNGYVDLVQLKESINPKTKLVTIIHGNNEIGTVQNIEEIGRICKDHNVLFHIDAVQSFTKVPIDVSKINVDMISISSHKIHGPKGVGALFVKKGTGPKNLMHGGSQEFKKRPGTENVAGIVGFAKAVSLSNDKDIEKISELRDYLIESLMKISDTFLNGPKDRLCNNVNIGFKHLEGEGILMHLDIEGIAVSTGSACSSHSLEPSHVLIATGLVHADAHGAIRFTLSKYTTKKELDYVIEKVKMVIENLRKFSPLVEKGDF